MTIALSQFDEVRLDRVSRDFGALNALRDVSLSIRRGEFIALLGPSGCGKSTTLNCIAGLLPVTGGAIWLDKSRVDTLRPEERGFGMVFQNYALFPHLNVRQNIGFGLKMRGKPKAEIDRKVDEALNLVRLRGQENKLPGQLSGGQQQRVAIARAIVIEPPLVLMDEPLSNLDAKLRLEMRAEIRRIHNELGATTIYVTHDQDEALSLADRIVVLRDGVIRQVGTPKELYEAPAHFDVADFMGFRNKLKGQVVALEGGRAVLDVEGARISGIARERVAVGSTRFCRHPSGRSRGRGGRLQCHRRERRHHRVSRPRIRRDGAFARRARLRVPLPSFGRARLEDSSAVGGRARSRLRGADPGEAVMDAVAPAPAIEHGPNLRQRLAARGFDAVTLLVVPAAIFTLLLFVYPFAFGFVLSFEPKAGGDWLANYRRFFSDPFLYKTIANTLWLAIPVTLVNLLLAVPIAFRVRLMRRQRLLTTILVLPITLGTVLVAEGLLNYLGPQGWFNRTLLTFGLISQPLKLVHNYWGVFASLVITGFPFTFLLTLSYVTGIDPALEQAAATLGASAWQRFRHVYLPLLMPGFAITFCLSFVQAFSVFPSAVLLGEPAGVTRVISIAAATAAFEEYDYSMASAIAMIMGFVQLGIVVAVLASRGLFYRGPASGAKG